MKILVKLKKAPAGQVVEINEKDFDKRQHERFVEVQYKSGQSDVIPARFADPRIMTIKKQKEKKQVGKTKELKDKAETK
jgi:hypothetical protein